MKLFTKSSKSKKRNDDELNDDFDYGDDVVDDSGIDNNNNSIKRTSTLDMMAATAENEGINHSNSNSNSNSNQESTSKDPRFKSLFKYILTPSGKKKTKFFSSSSSSSSKGKDTGGTEEGEYNNNNGDDDKEYERDGLSYNKQDKELEVGVLSEADKINVNESKDKGYDSFSSSDELGSDDDGQRFTLNPQEEQLIYSFINATSNKDGKVTKAEVNEVVIQANKIRSEKSNGLLKMASLISKQLNSNDANIVLMTLHVFDFLMKQGSLVVQFALSKNEIAQSMVRAISNFKSVKSEDGNNDSNIYDKLLQTLNDIAMRFLSSQQKSKTPGKPYAVAYNKLSARGTDFSKYNKSSKRESNLHQSEASASPRAATTQEEVEKELHFGGKAKLWKRAIELVKDLTKSKEYAKRESTRDAVKDLIVQLKKAESEIVVLIKKLENGGVDNDGNNLDTYLYLNEEIQIQKMRFGGGKKQSSLEQQKQDIFMAQQQLSPAEDLNNRGPRPSLITYQPVSLSTQSSDESAEAFETGIRGSTQSSFATSSSSKPTVLLPEKSDLNFNSFSSNPYSIPAPRVSSINTFTVPATPINVTSSNPFDSPTFTTKTFDFPSTLDHLPPAERKPNRPAPSLPSENQFDHSPMVSHATIPQQPRKPAISSLSVNVFNQPNPNTTFSPITMHSNTELGSGTSTLESSMNDLGGLMSSTSITTNPYGSPDNSTVTKPKRAAPPPPSSS